MPPSLPIGYRLAGIHCGIKSDAGKEDLSLIVSARPAVGVGVYTQNQFAAASVELNRLRTPSRSIRAVLVNSGNANACTGDQGDRDARAMARRAADLCGVAEDQVLVLSTGVIGEALPMERIERGIDRVAERLGDDQQSLAAAARGMLTTDTGPKIAGREVATGSAPGRLLGLAKGAAMIGPNMATMLAVILTDLALDEQAADVMLRAAVDDSFNAISVDGHSSTNDTVLLLANGQARQAALRGSELEPFRRALGQVCRELARAIVADGEGATHGIEIEITGCATRAAARQLAKTIANSPLVKTAVAGADPNWGRIVSAAGYADVPFDRTRVRLRLNGFLLFDKGEPVGHDAAKVSASIRANRDVRIELSFEEGEASARFWTTDLTAEYVRLNAEYHT